MIHIVKALSAAGRHTLSAGKTLAVSTALIGLSFGSVPLYAEDAFWDGQTDANWNDITNWDNGGGDPATVPGVTDTATFNGAGNGNTTINLNGSQSVFEIIFDTAAAAAYTIGIAGVDTLLLPQTKDGTNNDANIIVNASVTADQIIAADIVLGDGSGDNATFADQIEVQNFSLNSTLNITGDISTGTGGTITPGDNQRFWLTGPGDIHVSGDFNETATATSVDFMTVFIDGGGTKTFSGFNNSTTNDYLRWNVRGNGTVFNVTGADNSLSGGTNGARLEIRFGTVNFNQDQVIANAFIFGNGTGGNGDAFLNLGDGNTTDWGVEIDYFDDNGTANVATISGGFLRLTNTRNVDVEDNGLITGTDAELIINSDIISDDGSRGLTKLDAGTLRLGGNNSRAGNGINFLDIRQGTVQVSSDLNVGDNDIILGRAANDGTLEFLGSTLTDIDNQFRIGQSSATATGGGIILNNGTGTLRLTQGTFNQAVNQPASRTLTLGGANAGENTITGNIVNNTAGTLGLTKEGAGKWILAGTNTYTGETNLNAGQLDITGTVTSNVNVADGATLGGEGTITGNLVFGTSAASNLVVSGYTTDDLTVTGDVDTSNGVNVIVENTGAGAFDVLTYGTINTGSGGLDLSDFSTSAATSSRVGMATFNNVGSTITLDLGFETRTWSVGGAGTWDTSTTNWVEGDNLYVDGDHVIFDNTGTVDPTATGTITISNGGSAIAPGSITFNTGAGYTINGDAITIGSGGLNFFGDNADDDVRIDSELLGSGNIFKSGGGSGTVGTAIFRTDNSQWTGTTFVDQGDVQITNINGLGNDASNTITLSDTGDDGRLIIAVQGTLMNDIIMTNTGGSKTVRFDNGDNTQARAATVAGTITIQDVNSEMILDVEGQTDRRDIGGTTSGNVARTTHTLTVDGLITSSSNVADSALRKSDQGVLVLANENNDFTGALHVNNGTVEVSSIGNVGEASAAGAARSALGFHLRLGTGGTGIEPENNTGTLIYTGTGAESTDRVVRIGATGGTTIQGTGGGIIANNGGGGLTFTAANFNSPENTNATRIGARNLKLAGTFAGENEIQGVIADNLAITDVAEADAETVGITVDTNGIWKLSGTNTYSGKTAVDAGTLRIADETNIGANPAFNNADALSIGALGILNTTSTMTIDDANRGITITDGTIDTDGSTVLTISNVIAGTTVNKVGTGELKLDANNTFTAININAGTVSNTTGTDIDDAATVNLADDATALLRLDAAETVGVITGGGATGGNINLNANTLTLGNGSGDYAGAISGTGGLTKNGTGTQTLSGTNTYTGATLVSSGTLDITGSVDSAITVADGATLSGEGETDQILNLGDGGGGGAILSVRASTEPTSFNSEGLVVNNTSAPVTVNFSDSPTGPGAITILDFGGGGYTPNGGDVNNDFSVGSGLTISARSANPFAISSNAVILNTGFETRTWDNGSTDSLWNEGGASSLNWAESPTARYFDGDFVIFGDAPAAAQNITLSNGGAEIAPNSVTFTNTGGNTYTFGAAAGETLSAIGGISIGGANAAITFSNVIVDPGAGGTTAIDHSGSGILNLDGANTHSGGVSLTNGTLNIGDASALGTGTFDINSGTIDNTSGADLTLSTNNAQTWDGNFTYSGTTHSLDLGTGAVTLSGTRTVTVTNNELTVGGAIGDGGNTFGIVKDGAGTLTLNTANTFAGDVTVNAGILQAESNAGALGTGSLNLAGGNLVTVNDANLNFGNSVNVTANSEITVDRFNASATTTSTFGPLTIGNVTLERSRGANITGNNNAVVTFTGGTTLTGTATFAPNTRTVTNLGAVNESGGSFGIKLDGTAGNGVVTLANGGNFTGGITLGDLNETGNSGTIRANGATSFNSNDITVNRSGTIDLRNANSASGSAITVNEGTADVTLTLLLANNAATTFVVEDLDIGAGAQVNVNPTRASGSNTDLTHTLDVTNGITFAGGGTLQASGNNTPNFDLIIDSSTGGIVTNSGTVTFSATTSDLTINDIISGTAATINFGGANTSANEGSIFINAVNTYTGNTEIGHRTNQGSGLEAMVVLGVENAFNTGLGGTGGNLTMDAAGANTEFSTLNLNGFNQTVNALSTANDASAQKIITNEGGSDSVLTTGSRGGGGNFNGVIQDGATNTIALVKNGIGNLDFGGTNTYTGGTTINGGRLDLNHLTDTLADTGEVIINGGELRVENVDTVGLVTLISGVIGGTGTLTSGSNFAVQSGTVSANLAGAVGLDKTTAGTVTLSGTNTYTGATTVSGGTLNVTGSLTSDITVNDGGGLSGEGMTTGFLTLGDGFGSGTSLTIDTTTAGAFTSTNLTTVSTGGPVTVNLTGSGTGTVTVLTYGAGAGVYTGNVNTDFAQGSGFGTRTGAGTFNNVAGTEITVDTGILDLVWSGTDANATFWDIDTTSNFNAGAETFFEGDNVLMDDTASNFNPTLQSDLRVNNLTINATNSANDYDIAGAQTLTVDGVLTVTNAGTDTGNAGVDVRIRPVIAGNGSVFIGNTDGIQDAQQNSVRLDGANTYTGGTTIQEGRVIAANDDSFGTGDILMIDEGGGANRDPLLDLLSVTVDNDITISNTGGVKTIRSNNFNTTTSRNAILNGSITQDETGGITNFAFNTGAQDTLVVNGVISGPGNVRSNGGTAVADEVGGTLTLANNANSFTGVLLIDGRSTVRVETIGDAGVNSAAGAGSRIDLGYNNLDGTLEYTGSTAETNRQFRIGRNRNNTATDTGGGTIRNTGGGTLTFDNPDFNIAANTAITAARTLTFDGASGNDIVVDGAIVDNTAATGTIAVVKTGANTLTLNGTNTYTGATTVSEGTLIIDGSTAAGSAVSVEGTSLLGGGGTINDAVTIAGTARHTAGTTTGADVQTINGLLTYDDGATVTWNLVSNVAGAVSGDQFDQFTLNTGGDLAFGGTINLELDFTGLNFNDGFWNSQLNEWLIWDTGDTELAPLFNITNNVNSDWNTGNMNIFELRAGSSFGAGDANGIWLVQTSVIPEPSTFALMGLGLAGFGWFIRRRKRKATES